MLHDSTKTLLRSIVQSLEAVDRLGWDDLIESGKECLYEMHQMTKPSYRAHRGAGSDAKFPTRIPDSEGLRRAMPHVKSMVAAIRRKDQATALESGKAALAQANDIRASWLLARSPSGPTESVEMANLVPQHENPVGKHRPVVERRTRAPRWQAQARVPGVNGAG